MKLQSLLMILSLIHKFPIQFTTSLLDLSRNATLPVPICFTFTRYHVGTVFIAFTPLMAGPH